MEMINMSWMMMCSLWIFGVIVTMALLIGGNPEDKNSPEVIGRDCNE